MTTRLLDPIEWPRLDAASAETVWRLLDPTKASILVIEQDGQIVGTLTLMTVLHAECLWIHPDHRRSFGVMKRLLNGLWSTARALGFKALWSGSITTEMSNILRRIGGSVVPGKSYVYPVKGL